MHERGISEESQVNRLETKNEVLHIFISCLFEQHAFPPGRLCSMHAYYQKPS